MSKKFIWIIAVIVILIGASIYFALYRQRSSPSQTITNFEECAREGYPVGESYPRQCWTPDGKHFVEDITENPLPIPGPITIFGEITSCLPKKGSEQQTLECAIGLKGSDGRHYGLKNLFQHDPEYKFSVEGMRVEVSGTFSPEEMKGPDGNKYDVVGTVNVISIKKVEGNTSVGIVQPEDPNKIGFAPYPDYSLDSIPSTPISVKYLVEHRSALDGKTITVRGVVVGILSKEAACPPDRGACGAPMIFLADSAKTDRDKYLDLGIIVSEEEEGYIINKNAEVKVIVSGSKTGVSLAKVY